MWKWIFLSSLLFLLTNSFAQIVNGTGMELPAKQFSNWFEKGSGYTGVYYFGMSEWESELLIIQTDEFVEVQLKFQDIIVDNEGEFVRFKTSFQNLENNCIKNDSLLSGGLKGQFKYFNDGQSLTPGLILYESPFNLIDKNEFGIRINAQPETYFDGDYPFASAVLIDGDRLSEFNREELKIIRNEIFARYGHDFKEGGEMNLYFKSKEWYSPESKDISNLLTEIEKRNIYIILEMEAIKK
jgi:hypothetical protein